MSVIIKNESLNFRMIWLEESYANEVVISVFFEVDSFFRVSSTFYVVL